MQGPENLWLTTLHCSASCKERLALAQATLAQTLPWGAQVPSAGASVGKNSPIPGRFVHHFWVGKNTIAIRS